MNKKSEIIKDGMLVTIGGFVAFAAAFILYYLIFTIFETVTGSYSFVSPVRIGYGIIWLGLCLILYRTKISDRLKASMLAGSLATFSTGIGVTLHEQPIIVSLVIFLVAATAVFLLHKMKKKWYHYYAIVISLIAAVFYLLPGR